MKRIQKALGTLLRKEEGLTGLETAIILIAFVTVAAVFGYAVLSAGIFSADKAKGTIYQGMEEAKSSMEVKGSVIATSAAGTEVSTVEFVVANAIGEYPIDLSPQGDANNVTVISYADENQYVEEIEGWSITQLAGADTDNLLEIGEQFLVTIPVDSTNVLTTALTENTVFTLELKPPHGATIVVSRRTPAELDSVMDLK
jgi:flagellin FlaB